MKIRLIIVLALCILLLQPLISAETLQRIRLVSDQDHYAVTVAISKNDAKTLERLVNNLRQKIVISSTHEEMKVIFEDFLEDLERNGFLNGFSLQKAKALVLGTQNSVTPIVIPSSSITGDTYENHDCLVIGQASSCYFHGRYTQMLTKHKYEKYGPFGTGWALDYVPLLGIFSMIRLYQHDSIVCFGLVHPGHYGGGFSYYSDGWIQTSSPNDLMNYSGSFIGNLNLYGNCHFPTLMIDCYTYPGISNFSGIQIGALRASPIDPYSDVIFIGHADDVKIIPHKGN
jgi:hypothetical protein